MVVMSPYAQGRYDAFTDNIDTLRTLTDSEYRRGVHSALDQLG